MTRAEFTSALMRAAVITNPEAQLAEINFSDIDKSYWAYDDIAKAVSIGFISGYDDGTFRPADNVTYEQAITMIFHVLGYKIAVSTSSNVKKPFILHCTRKSFISIFEVLKFF